MPPPAPSTKENKRRKYDQNREARKENVWVRSPEMPCEEGRQRRAALGEGS